MAAKIIGDFKIDENSFPFTAIAFGRIGGQNIGAKLSNETENKIKELGYDLNIEKVIAHYKRIFCFYFIKECLKDEPNITLN